MNPTLFYSTKSGKCITEHLSIEDAFKKIRRLYKRKIKARVELGGQIIGESYFNQTYGGTGWYFEKTT